MLGFVGFLKKKLDLEGKLPDKWKDVQLPKYYCFRQNKMWGGYLYCYIKSEDGFGSNIQVYTLNPNAAGGGAYALAASTEELDAALESGENARKNGIMSWDGVSDTGIRSGDSLVWNRDPEHDLY